ncbi:hypothetical protein C8R48DRAFT_669997 [Suillus tomentosus]|nr:hypothetical protein C8R48DRAFT_669997 [Suillus tomentosus]
MYQYCLKLSRGWLEPAGLSTERMSDKANTLFGFRLHASQFNFASLYPSLQMIQFPRFVTRIFAYRGYLNIESDLGLTHCADFFHPYQWEQLAAMQPTRHLLPPDDGNSDFDASHNLYAPGVTMTRMPAAPPQPSSRPENGGGHASIMMRQFSVSESDSLAGSGQQLPTNNFGSESEPGSYNPNYLSFDPESYDAAGLRRMASMPHLPPRHPHVPAIGAMHNQPGQSQFQVPIFSNASRGMPPQHPQNAPAIGAMHIQPSQSQAPVFSNASGMPPQHPQNAPAIDAMHNQPGQSQFQVPIFSNASRGMPPQHPQNAPAIGAMHNQPSQSQAPVFSDASGMPPQHPQNAPAIGAMHNQPSQSQAPVFSDASGMPPQHPQKAPAIGTMHNQPGSSQFQAPMFTNAMPPQSHYQSPVTPAFGTMYNNVMNPGIAQNPLLVPGPLHYYPSPNMGPFYPAFSEPVMKSNNIALPLGAKYEPRREAVFNDEDTTSGPHVEQYRQGSKAQGTFKFREYQWQPKKRGKVATGRVEKSSSRSQTSSLASSTALPIPASAPVTSAHHRDLVYDENNAKHQSIAVSAEHAIITDAVNNNCLTDSTARQQLVLQELSAAAISEFEDESFGNNWATVNSETLYTNLSATYEKIMQTCKKIARSLVQLGYHLRPPAWTDTVEPEHQADLVTMLIDDTILFPPRYVFGEDENTHESHFLENVVVWHVLLNTIMELRLRPYLKNLDKMFCLAAAAVKCALMELRTGTFMEIDFTFQGFRHIYEELLKHIDEYIFHNPKLWKRWNAYKAYTLKRLDQLV